MHDYKPLVGVFVTNSVIKAARSKPPFDKNGLQEASREAKVLLYFFSIKDVDLENQIITGTYYNEETKRWDTAKYNFPDVIYNRRSEGSTPKIRKFRERAAALGIKTINPINDFNKWELYCYLATMPELKSHLPHTVLYHQEQDIQDMLKQYQTIYLKPAVGRYSRKVVRVKLRQDNFFEYSYVDDRLRLEVAESWDQLVNFYRPFYDRRKFIVQEAINVLRFNGQHVDFRAELQRNGRGHLEIVAISARLAALHSPVTSTRAGTAVYKFADLFKSLANYSDLELIDLYNRVSDFLLKVYRNVEKVYGMFGDMGIDFALDQHFNFRLIECNAKSAKVACLCPMKNR